jgi:PAS domain S-box-containing protein
MRILSLKRLAPYGLAVLSVALATVIRLELYPLLDENAPLLIFAIAVILTSWFGGFWPGALATALSLLTIDYLFFAPKYSIFRYDSRLDQIRAVSFVIFGILSSLIFARLREGAKAERRIRERFRLLVEGVKDYAIFMLDDQGHVVSWNPGAERIKGYRANEIIGRDFSVFYTPKDIESGQPQRVQEIAAAEGRYEESGWQVRRDGSRFWASGVIAAIHDDKGRLCGFTIITRDITDRRMIEERARFLGDLDQALRPLADSEEIMTAAARMLGEHLGADHCAYAEIEDNEKYLKITTDYTCGDTRSVVGRFPVDDLGSEALRLMRADRPYVVNDIEAEASARIDLSAYRQAEIRALLCAPLIKNGHYVARMAVSQKKPRYWEPWEIELVAKVTDRCWESVERSRTARNLQASEERYRAFIANSSEAIWRFELEQPIPITLPEDEQIEMLYKYAYLAECNDAMARMYGYERADQILGARIGDLLPRSDPRNIAYLRALKRSGYRLIDAEMCEVDRLGNKKYFLSNQIGIVENGAVVRGWGMQRDITERKEAEEARRESEEQARRQLAQVEAIYATAPVGLCFVDTDLRYININERLTEIHGRSVEEHLGRTMREVLPEVADTLEPFFRRVIETGEPALNVEQSVAPASELGAVRHFIFNFYPIKNGGGRVLGVNVVVMEITHRKQIEEELEHLLRQEKAAREEAEAANRMKDEFLATISHELRTPLTSILGWARMLTVCELNAPQARHAIEVIAQSAQSQTRLIEDILDTSRIITGCLTLDVRPVAIDNIFHAAVDVIRPSAEAKGISLSEVVEAPDGVVLGDASRLQQAFCNLLSNAVKFTNEGGRIEARLGCDEGQIEITVTDTGIGIDPRFLHYVFDRFRQADASSTREYGGLGIGLAIARHVVEMHGGSVSASSPGKGHGATFKIKLPPISASRLTRPEGPRAGAPPPSIELKVSENGHRLDGVRVLLVEDDPVTLDMLKFILERSGAEVITANSADEALDALERFRPDTLVSDIAMPDRDGCDLIREVRSREPERGGKIPAVAVTAYARAEDRVRVLAAGFQMHIPKPIDPDELIAVVASLKTQDH